MLNISPLALEKLAEIAVENNREGDYLRIRVVGGGCAGFSYHMGFEEEPRQDDEVVELDDLYRSRVYRYVVGPKGA